MIALLIGSAVAADQKAESSKASIRLLPDLVISSFMAKLTGPNTIQYWWAVTNIGTAPANLDGPTASTSDNVAVQAYLGTDTVWASSGSIPAGGIILTGTLAPHASQKGSFSSNFQGNIGHFNYLVLKVNFNNVMPESNHNNNTAAVGVAR